jgi:hypothetical protein
VGYDQLFILAIIVVADIGLEMHRSVEEVFETFNAPGEKVSPLMALQNWSAGTVEVNHAAEVGVIPAAKGNSRNEVFFIDEAKDL